MRPKINSKLTAISLMVITTTLIFLQNTKKNHFLKEIFPILKIWTSAKMNPDPKSSIQFIMIKIQSTKTAMSMKLNSFLLKRLTNNLIILKIFNPKAKWLSQDKLTKKINLWLNLSFLNKVALKASTLLIIEGS